MVEISQVLLGLAGVEVLDAVEVFGEVHVRVQTINESPVACPCCGVLARAHARREVRLRDLPIGGRPAVLVWRKRVWRCREPLCPKRTWTETHPELPARRVLTERAAVHIASTIAGSCGAVVSSLAASFGVAWSTAWEAFLARAAPAVATAHRELAAPRAAGVDETTFLRRGAGSFGQRWCTSIVDLATPRLLDVVAGRSSVVITDWIAVRPQEWADAIAVTVCDPFRPYAHGLRKAIPDAELVIDHYHVVKLGLDTLDQVRINVTRETLGRRGAKGDHLFDLRRRLRTAPERLTDTHYGALAAGLGHGDPHGHVREAWRLAHQLRRIGAASTARGARRRLDAVITGALASPRPEVRKLGRTLREWRTPIFARYRHGRITNAAAEAFNTLIKKLKRAGHGYRNFHNYRLRLLTACGKIPVTQTRTTARLRTRRPRLDE